MKRKPNMEKELKQYYKKEAASFVLPDEESICVIACTKSKKNTASRIMMRRFVAVAACVAAVAAVAVAVPLFCQGKNNLSMTGKPLAGDTKPGTTVTNSKPSDMIPDKKDPVTSKESTHTTNGAFMQKDVFALNMITNMVSGAPLYYAPEQYDKKTWNAAKIKTYFGVDLRKALDGTAAKRLGMDDQIAALSGLSYQESGDFSVTFRKDGTLVEDTSGFFFSDNKGKTVTLSASKLRQPYDCVYELETNKMTPLMGESGKIVPVLVAAEITAEKTLYVADFSCCGVFYRVKTENITPLELYAILLEITAE